MNKVAPYAKAVIGALIAGLGAIGTALTDGTVTPAEYVAAVVAFLVAGGAVFQVKNGDPAADGEAGESPLILVLAVAGIVLLLLVLLGKV